MSKELIERLRADAESTDDIGLCADAAERIEELERKVASRDAEVAKLKDDNEYLYVAAIERDQLSEQVKMLRDELLWHKEHTYNPFEPDNQCNAHKRICEALAATPEQSIAEYRNKVIEAFVNEFSRHVGGDGEFWLHELQYFAMKEQP